MSIPATLFLIDGNSIICRYFYGLPERKSPDGLNINGVFGFSRFLYNFLHQEITKNRPDFSVIICFDKAKNNFRKTILSTYKGNRKPFPENFFQQMRLCEEVCEYFNILIDYNDVYEADDLIATYCKKFKHVVQNIYVLSNDKDLLQLVTSGITVLNVAKKKYFNTNTVKNTMQIFPSQIPDFLAIAGDASDNISGIFSIGPKTTIKLLNEFGSLAEIIKQKANFLPALEFLKLTKLIDNTPVKNTTLPIYSFPVEKVISCFKRYGFSELITRIITMYPKISTNI
jgi:DNA polymerase I